MELREKIIQAAKEVIQTKGLSRTTTKEIARLANCSEGSIYNNFENKEDLFLYVLRGELRNLMSALTILPDRIGTRTVRENLEEVAIITLEDYYRSMPLMASIFSDPSLLTRQREGFKQRNEGPHRANEAIESYLHEEQLIGRLSLSINPRAAADMILGSCFQYAFQMNFLGNEHSDSEAIIVVYRTLDTLFRQIDVDYDCS
ncbi:TetR/AcrR family transcriptional regulator [Halalkalibacter sp. AB-rgal2]|uniref:TetR/AcrR family transcriptional regulator n=1 Tax=Halalkalibacter sp. AB-rgal2 TaxID=3242695 RepID=UPI00359E977F